MGCFGSGGRVQKLFGGILIYTNNFCFLSMAQLDSVIQIYFFLRTNGRGSEGRTH